MGTNDIDILILKYLSGAVRPDEISSLLQWMNESPENRKLLMRKKSLWDASHLPFSYESIDVGKAQSEMMERIAADKVSRAVANSAAAIALPRGCFMPVFLLKCIN